MEPARPHVNAAIFCRGIVREADGLFGIFGMVGELIRVAGSGRPLPYADLKLAILVAACGFTGTTRLTVEEPGAEPRPGVDVEVSLTDPEQLAWTLAPVPLPADFSALRYFDVALDGVFAMRVPLPVSVVRPDRQG